MDSDNLLPPCEFKIKRSWHYGEFAHLDAPTKTQAARREVAESTCSGMENIGDSERKTEG